MASGQRAQKGHCILNVVLCLQSLCHEYSLPGFRASTSCLKLDSNGQAGELAFLLLMARGFDTSPGCKNGSELFREVKG
jgi:hypothetical protein